MALDFTTLGTEVTATPATAGISLDLSKDSFLDLTKHTPGLTKVNLAAGWDLTTAGASADLDIAAFLVGANGRLVEGAKSVIFFNNKTGRGISLDGDNRTGAGEGDDETISINLEDLDPRVERIITGVVIHDAEINSQTFGMVKNAYVRLVNGETQDELCKFRLTDDYSTDTAVLASELVRGTNGWAFHTIGDGYRANLNVLASRYI